jgi:hypothetical protein
VYAAGVSCGTPACAGGMISRGACDGQGTCGPGAAAPCPGGFACASATTCGTICQDDGGCAPGRHCDPSTHGCR